MKPAKLFKTPTFGGVAVSILPTGARFAPVESGEPTVELDQIPISNDELAAEPSGPAKAQQGASAAPRLAARRWIHAEEVLAFERIFEDIAQGKGKLSIDASGYPGALEQALGAADRPGVNRAFREKILRCVAYMLATPAGRAVIQGVVGLATPTVVRGTFPWAAVPANSRELVAVAKLRKVSLSEPERIGALGFFAPAFAEFESHSASLAKKTAERRIREYDARIREATRRGAVSAADVRSCARLLGEIGPLVATLSAVRKSGITTAPVPAREKPNEVYVMPAWTNGSFVSLRGDPRPPALPCPYGPAGAGEWADSGYTPLFVVLAHELIHVIHSEHPQLDWSLLDALEAALGQLNPARPETAGKAALAVARALEATAAAEAVWTSDEERTAILGPGPSEAMIRCENGLGQRYGHGSWSGQVPAGTAVQMKPERWLSLFRQFGPSAVVGDYCGVAAPELIARLARR